MRRGCAVRGEGVQYEERVCSAEPSHTRSTRRGCAVGGEGVQLEESKIKESRKFCIVLVTIVSALLVLHTLSSYCGCDSAHTAHPLLELHTLSSYCGCDSPRTAHPLLVLHTLSSNCTPSPRTAGVTRLCTAHPLLVLHTLSSHCTPSPPTAHPLLVLHIVYTG